MKNESSRIRVLVVEDEALIRWTIAETLRDAGHRVSEAGDGASAVRALTETSEQFKVVLLDYRLPDSNDLTLLANVRRLSPGSCVVLMTAFGTPELITRASDLGVCRILHKPFDVGEMAKVVREASV